MQALLTVCIYKVRRSVVSTRIAPLSRCILKVLTYVSPALGSAHVERSNGCTCTTGH
jgi:hypothetical protein